MKNVRNIIFYVVVIGGFGYLMYLIVNAGQPLEAFKVTNVKVQPIITNGLDQIKDTLHHNVTDALAILILQIITIIVAAKVFGFLFKKMGQPTVIGEIVAGIVLGPSFVGMYFPEFSAFIFPKTSLPNLKFFSQIGLILFMFIIGMELDLKTLGKKAHEAFIISHASIIFPFALGMGLAYFIYQSCAPANVSFLPFSLFMGISLSITAFPVLARIVQERQLTKTRVGVVAITCAAVDDITAWCILAAVIAIVKAGSVVSAIYTVLLAVAFVLLMLKVVRPFLKRIGDIYSHQDTLSKSVVAIFFVTLLASAYLADVIGIHALFGAFIAGVIMPQNVHFRNVFIEKVEDVSLVLLLPLFFVLSGLRTQIGLLNDLRQWEICGLIIVLAVTGKFIGSAVAAKFTKQSWRDSLTIGALMNTRGLTELIALNIGFELGILTPSVFAMMVIMALVTTFMTGPALDFINYIMPEKKSDSGNEDVSKYKKFKILFSFGDVERGKSMVRLSNSFVNKNQENTLVSALHMELSNEVHQYNIHEVERESFKPITREANKLNLPLQTYFKPTLDFQKELIDTANEGEYDLLLVGIGQSIYEGSFFGRLLGITSKLINPEKLYNTITGKEKIIEENGFDDKTNTILRSIKSPVGVFTDKGLKKVDDVVFFILSDEDAFLLPYAQKLIHNNESRVMVIDYYEKVKQNTTFKESIRAIEQTAPNHIALYDKNKVSNEFLKPIDLMIISLDAWKQFLEIEPEWFSSVPSLLIMRK
ncbi:MAG TPA: cation:proton antiporter [Bacteroidia bacterium]|nr:cation:proton antiporter [Bacteroidia bacterium]